MSDEPEEGGWTPGDVTGVIANPFYAIQIDPALAVPHEPLLGEDQVGSGQRAADRGTRRNGVLAEPSGGAQGRIRRRSRGR
jgi:hypothetical protein